MRILQRRDKLTVAVGPVVVVVVEVGPEGMDVGVPGEADSRETGVLLKGLSAGLVTRENAAITVSRDRNRAEKGATRTSRECHRKPACCQRHLIPSDTSTMRTKM